MARSDQLTAGEYQPATETRTTGGSPSHMDIPIHPKTLQSGELHARLDPVAFPQAGASYAGTVAGQAFPATPVALRDEAQDRSGSTYVVTKAGAVKPVWTQEPAQTHDTFGIEDGWGVSIAGHQTYKLALEIANGANVPTQFAAVTLTAPVDDLSTGLSSIGGGKEVNAIYIVKASDAVLPANAQIIKRFAAAYVPPAGNHWSVTPTLDAGKDAVATGVAVITTTGSLHFGVTYNTGTSDPHYFAYSTVNGPGTFDQAGQISVLGQGGTITELWVSTDSSRANAVLVQAFS